MKATIPGNLDPGPGGINLRTTFTSQFGRLRSLSLCVGFSEFALPALISIEVSSSRSFCRPASQRSNPAHISANRARPSCRLPQDPGTFARENREFTGCNLTNANPKLRQISGRTDIASSCFSRRGVKPCGSIILNYVGCTMQLDRKLIRQARSLITGARFFL